MSIEVNLQVICDKIARVISDHVPEAYFWHVAAGFSFTLFSIGCLLFWQLPYWVQFLLIGGAVSLVWYIWYSEQTPEWITQKAEQFRVSSQIPRGAAASKPALANINQFTPVKQTSGHQQRSPARFNNAAKDVRIMEDDDRAESSVSGAVSEGLATKNQRRLEPLDPVTISRVASPGFSTRLIQQRDNTLNESIGGSSPSGKKNNSWAGAFGSFGSVASPNGGLNGVIGPYKPSPTLSPPSYQSPVRGSSMIRRRKQIPYGTTFVPMGPAEPITPELNTTTPVISKPTIGMPGSSMMMGERGPPVVHVYTPPFGGLPPMASMATKIYTKPWSPPVETLPPPYEARRVVASPVHMGSPEMSMNRKRNRMVDGMGDKRMSPIRPGSPVRSPEDLTKAGNKRTKYVQMNELRYDGSGRTSPYVDVTEAESMNSESILEQMSQTEKMFLPDEDSSNRLPRKFPKGMASKASLVAIGVGPYRKRRVPAHSITTLVEEDQSEKARGFCECTECYADAAGFSRQDEPQLKTSVVSVPSVKRKKLGPFQGSSISQYERTGIIKAATNDREDEDITEKMDAPLRMPILTRERYEADRKKRQERLERMLQGGYKKPESSTTPVNGFSLNTGTDTVTPIPSASEKNAEEDQGTKLMNGDSVTSPTTSTSGASFSFGLSKPIEQPTAAATTSSGFSFGAPVIADTKSSEASFTVVTSADSAPKTTFSFGTANVSEGFSGTSTATAPAFTFGSSTSSTSSDAKKDVGPTSGTPAITSAAPSLSSSLSTGFSFGGSTPASSTAASNLSSSTGMSSGLTFGSTPTTSSVAATTVPAISTPTSSFTFGTTQAEQPSITTSGGAPNTSVASGFSFGQSNNFENNDTDLANITPTFSFGQSPALSTSAPLAAATTSSIFGQNNNVSTTTTTASSTITSPGIFGQPTASGSTVGQTSLGGTSTGGFSFGSPATTGQATSEKQTFGFGGSATIQPPATTASAGLGSTPAFSFSQNTLAGTPTSTFGQQTTAPNPGATFGQTAAPNPGATFGSNSFGQNSSASTGLGAFGQQSGSGSSIFGSTTSAPPPYGATTSTTSNTSSSFGATSTPSVFGQQNSSSATTGGFGSTSVTSPPSFGAGTTPSFGSAATSPAPTFGGTGTTAAASPFGNTTSQPSGSIFGSSTTGTTSSTFGQGGQATSPAFGSTTKTPGFGQSNQTSAPSFGQATTPAFGQTSQTPAFGSNAQATPPTFGGNIQTTTPAFGQGQSTQPTTATFGQTSTVPSGTFNFGQSSGTTSAATAPAFGSSSTGTSGGAFQFGQQPASSPPSFSFGGTAATSPPAFGAGASQTPAFGASASQTPAFGAGAPAAPSTGGFNFGQPSATPGVFNFGAQQQPPAFGAAAPQAGGMFSIGSSGSTTSNRSRASRRPRR